MLPLTSSLLNHIEATYLLASKMTKHAILYKKIAPRLGCNLCYFGADDNSNCLPCPQYFALRRRSRDVLALPASLGFRLKYVSATGGARLRPHYQNRFFARQTVEHTNLLENRKTAPVSGCCFICFGADEQIRTAYLLITNEVLYRLSYISAATNIIAKPAVHCKC